MMIFGGGRGRPNGCAWIGCGRCVRCSDESAAGDDMNVPASRPIGLRAYHATSPDKTEQPVMPLARDACVRHSIAGLGRFFESFLDGELCHAESRLFDDLAQVAVENLSCRFD